MSGIKRKLAVAQQVAASVTASQLTTSNANLIIETKSSTRITPRTKGNKKTMKTSPVKREEQRESLTKRRKVTNINTNEAVDSKESSSIGKFDSPIKHPGTKLFYRTNQLASFNSMNSSNNIVLNLPVASLATNKEEVVAASALSSLSNSPLNVPNAGTTKASRNKSSTPLPPTFNRLVTATVQDCGRVNDIDAKRTLEFGRKNGVSVSDAGLLLGLSVAHSKWI